jgi:hypothetical protein
VNGGIEEAQTEAGVQAVEQPRPKEPSRPAPRPSWQRLAYVAEFLLAIDVVLNLWAQIGGQGHLDLLPWYTKLLCVVALAWCAVRMTAAAVEGDKAWNRRTRLWLVGVLAISIAMGGITFYYHLHEMPDETDNEDSTATSVSIGNPGADILQI